MDLSSSQRRRLDFCSTRDIMSPLVASYVIRFDIYNFVIYDRFVPAQHRPASLTGERLISAGQRSSLTHRRRRACGHLRRLCSRHAEEADGGWQSWARTRPALNTSIPCNMNDTRNNYPTCCLSPHASQASRQRQFAAALWRCQRGNRLGRGRA